MCHLKSHFFQLWHSILGVLLLVQRPCPHKNGVGPLESDLSLINPPCFIGSCKVQGRLIRMASFSKECDRNVFPGLGAPLVADASLGVVPVGDADQAEELA